MDAVSDYRVFHQAPRNDGYSSSLDRLADAYGDDVYAIQADQQDDWPIIHADVPARLIFTDGNDLSEYGYDGPALTGLEDAGPVQDMWSDRDVYYHAAHRALLDGTTRAKLAADYEVITRLRAS